jgi:4-amino-4-deoxy-L-arabinose transferase-like glycosyltransferase
VSQQSNARWTRLFYWSLWTTIVVLYLVWPLAHLEAYAWSNDEGLYVQRAALANAGYPLYTETFFNKPPLLVWVLQLAFRLAGETLATARLASLCVTLVGFIALGKLVELLWGRWAGVAAMLVYLGIPEVPVRAHVVMSDLPAMACAVAAMGLALAFRRSGKRVWLALSGVAYAGALLIHPLLLYTALPLAVIVLLPGLGSARARWRDLLAFLVAVVVPGVLVLAAIDRQAFLTWGIKYNVGTVDETLRHGGPGTDWLRIVEYLKERWTLVGLAAIGVVIESVNPTGRRGLAIMLAWFLATVVTLLAWSPIWEHYMLFLVVPLAAIAGSGLATTGEWLVAGCKRRDGWTRWRVAMAVIAITGLAVFAVQRAGEDMPQLETGPDWSPSQLAVRAFLEENVAPGEFVAADDPLLAFSAHRLVPPPFTGASHKRIRSGYLTSEDMIVTVSRYRVRTVLYATGRLKQLPEFERWAESWACARFDFGSMWAYQIDLPPAPDGPVSQLGAGISLQGYDLASGEPHPGDAWTVTLFWKRNDPINEDYTVFLHLVDENGNVWSQYDGPPMEGYYPTSHWAEGVLLAGRCTLMIDPETPPGEYRLLGGMYSWPSLVRLPAVRPDGDRWPDDLITLAELQVVVP